MLLLANGTARLRPPDRLLEACCASLVPRSPPGSETFAYRHFLTLQYICFYERTKQEEFAMNNSCVIVFKIKSYFSKEASNLSVSEPHCCCHGATAFCLNTCPSWAGWDRLLRRAGTGHVCRWHRAARMLRHALPAQVARRPSAWSGNPALLP